MNASDDRTNQIENQLRNRYLERLAIRVKKIRSLLVERNWEELRAECGAIAGSTESFGLPTLRELAQQVEELIPPGRISRASALPDARAAVESLLTAMDVLLTNHQMERERELKS